MNAEKFFGTNELYKILELEPGAPINDGKKIIYKTKKTVLFIKFRLISSENQLLSTCTYLSSRSGC